MTPTPPTTAGADAFAAALAQATAVVAQVTAYVQQVSGAVAAIEAAAASLGVRSSGGGTVLQRSA